MKKSIIAYIIAAVVILIACSGPAKQSSMQLEASFIYDTASFPSCHASTIAETPAGMVAAWFGGTEEKHKDVEIWLSRMENDKWTVPVSVANGVQDSTKRFPCWNPVLFQYPNGPLFLFYKVGADPVEWWGELIRSDDNGKTWSRPVRLPDGILGPIKNKPVLLNDGRLVCPSSTEHPADGRWQVHLEITTDTAKTWTRSEPLNDGLKFHVIQPSILAHSGNKLQMLCRSMENRIASMWSHDGGLNWSDVDTIHLPNPNSGTDAVTLQNGWHLLVYNPTVRYKDKWGGPRTPLNVAVSKDGLQWKDIVTLESEPGEYSYPAVIQATDGTVHITYTWKREKIKYVKLVLDEIDFSD